jgi:anti-sigma B factor antagonist
MTATFSVEVERLDDRIHAVKVSGELDQATAPELSRPLMDAADSDDPSILLDFSDCEFIDSTGLALLVEARRRVLDSNGRMFGLCCANAQVRRLLDVTGIDRGLKLYDTRDEAVAALSGR